MKGLRVIKFQSRFWQVLVQCWRVTVFVAEQEDFEENILSILFICGLF
jgi:hypothetical protein